MRSLVIKLNPTEEQRMQFDYDLRVSNYTYNKTVRIINSRTSSRISKFTLRDQLVTEETRKDNVLLNKVNSTKARIERIVNDLKSERTLKSMVKAVMIKRKWWSLIKVWYDHLRVLHLPKHNDSLKSFETKTPKDIRAGSVFEAHANYTNCLDAIKSGRIKFFKLKYRSKKKNGMSMILPKSMIRIKNGVLRLTSKELSDKIIRVNRRTQRKLTTISSLKDCRLTKKFGTYHLHIPLDIMPEMPESLSKVIGIDPGVSTFLSCYTPDRNVLIKQTDRCWLIDRLRSRLKWMRKQNKRKRIRRRTMNRMDLKKQYITDELHWQSINYLVKNYDLIFIEKFDSQGFVKNSSGDASKRGLNRNTNNLKPYLFRTRLLYKAQTYGKIVKVVAAHNTTKTCSSCGNVQPMTLSDRVYNCKGCNLSLDRDFNAAKNMIIKGLLC